MQCGELIVTGKNKVEIELSKRPEKVIAEFIGDCCLIPCNQQNYDFFEWHIKIAKSSLFKKKYFLVLIWTVVGVRKINWEVCY